MEREITQKHPAKIDPVKVDESKSITNFLDSQATGYTHLLAHAEDGVIWGRVDGTALKISTSLMADTLLEARLFGKTGELLAWKDGDGNWHARTIQDGGSDSATFKESYDEAHMLWGTHTGRQDANGFIELIDGAQGMVHWAPAVDGLTPHQAEQELPKRLLQLTVRHYLQEDEITGALRVVASRLVELSVVRRVGGR